MTVNLPLPPLSLQQQFAGIVAQVEQLRQKQRKSERELEVLFQGLLQRYFG
jgi:type I restriction enzyme, S subunit